MQTGIVGLPYSGKSTLFSTLLAYSHIIHEESAKHKQEAERGVVKVPDERLDQLTKIIKPKRQVNATIEFIKVPGLDKEKHQGSGLPPQFLANTKTVELILVMIRAFENEMYPHPLGKVDPWRDINFIESEFLLNDLAIAENRIDKLEKLIQKTQGEKDKKELQVLQRCRRFLDGEHPLRDLHLPAQEEVLIRSYQFLSLKPVLFVLNIAESDIKNYARIEDETRARLKTQGGVVALSAEIEKEIAQLNPEDAQSFLADMQIAEPALSRVIHAAFHLLGLRTFFTIGENECHAWPFREGIHAQQAAGIVHSDMEKGFIRAEVIPSPDLIRLGSVAACKEKGYFKLEGKDYLVQDGDVLTIRFNV
jgi:GTP-binding protein YchF